MEKYNYYNRSLDYRSKIIALLLWWFLGGLSIHNFYLNRKNEAISQLILFVVGIATCWILIGFIPLIIWIVWIYIDLFHIILADEPDFDWPISEP